MKNCPLIVLTRFNLAISFETNKRYDSKVPIEKPWLDEKYLEERFKIFEQYTFSSFAKQSDSKFKWIVMFHADTPLKFKERIEKFSRQMEQFNAWFLDDSQCKCFADIIKEYLKAEYPDSEIITVRVDNDDMVHENFVASIKNDFDACRDFCVLTYINGLQYDIAAKRLLRYRYENNHFLSLYVPSTNGDNNILLYNHYTIDKVIEAKTAGKLIRVSEVPLWVEIITETNYSNTARYRLSTIYIPYKLRKEYPLLGQMWKSYPEYLCGGDNKWNIYCYKKKKQRIASCY